ncbi:MAG: rhodanese-like domain-containing protein [Planctomycetota bacterium]
MLVVAMNHYACQGAEAGEGESAVDHAELVALIEAQEATLLDANGTRSYERAHIPGAIDFARAEKAGTLAEQLPAEKDALIVAYCGGPGCKAYTKATGRARELGYTNVKHFPGGIRGWTAAQEKEAAAASGDAVERFPAVTHPELVQALEAGAVPLDANGTASYEKGHIPGALDYAALSSADELADALPDDKATTIIAYCGGPRCMAYKAAAEAAAALGYTDVKHYPGGISGWREHADAGATKTSACGACGGGGCGACGAAKPKAAAGCGAGGCSTGEAEEAM